MRRHPAGRSLTGLFTQTHPWPASVEPVNLIERDEGIRRRPACPFGWVEPLERRVAELETRLARLEGGDTLEVPTLAEEAPRVVPL